MAEIIKQDFGRERREACRKLSRLIGLVEAQERELEDDPRRLLDLAGGEIVRLKRGIDEACEALRPRVYPYYPSLGDFIETRTMVVDREELERLRKAADIIRRLRQNI